MEGQNLIAYKHGIIKLFFLILLGFGKKHLTTIELASCVVSNVFCGLMTVCVKTQKNFRDPLNTL